MKTRTVTLATSLLVLLASGTAMAQKADNSQAGGLPALAAEVALLKQQVAALQSQVAPEYPEVYAGSYFVVLFENASYGCGTTNNPLPLLGTPGFLQYLTAQANSSTTADTAVFTAESDGYTINFPDFDSLRTQLNLSGKTRVYELGQDAFTIGINGDGSLDIGAEVDPDHYSGQMAANGSVFTILAGSNDADGNCVDSNATMMIGIRI